VYEFWEASTTFRRAHGRLVTVLSAAQILPQKMLSGVSVLGWDVRDCSSVLAASYETAVAFYLADMTRRHREWPIPAAEEREPWGPQDWERWFAQRPPTDWSTILAEHERRESGLDPFNQLAVVIKLMFFLLRAYVDAVARALIVANEEQAGRRTSMNTALASERNVVSTLVREQIPGFAEWFTTWRDLRNDEKVGAPLNFAMQGDEVGVVFAGVPAQQQRHDLTTDEVIFLSDIAAALNHCARLADAAQTWIAEERLLDDDRAAVRAQFDQDA
jgi:hypothetical protein